MIYKRFYWQVILRVLAILLLCLLTAWLCFATSISKAIAIPLMMVIGFQTYGLIYYLNKTNRLLSTFFDSVANNDSALLLSSQGMDKNYELVKQSLGKLNTQLQELKIKNEQSQILLEAIIENAAVGILCLDDSGRVLYSSKRGRNLLGLNHLSHLKALLKIDEKLVDIINELVSDEQQVYKLRLKGKHAHLVFHSAIIEQGLDKLRIVSFTDIQNQLVSKELDSWQKLIRVLNHEIMNSIAPITSLSDSLHQLYEPIQANDTIGEELLDDTQTGLEVITEQGKGLIAFVQSYRELSRLPEPKLKPVLLQSLLKKVQLLMKMETLDHCDIKFVNKTPNDLSLQLDESQMIQVITNLIKNAGEAIQQDGKVQITAYQDADGLTTIEIADNGKGIDEENLSNIFIPFYTTKDNGSGIGLTIVSQIVRKHGGMISVESNLGEGTVFKISF